MNTNNEFELTGKKYTSLRELIMDMDVPDYRKEEILRLVEEKMDRTKLSLELALMRTKAGISVQEMCDDVLIAGIAENILHIESQSNEAMNVGVMADYARACKAKLVIELNGKRFEIV